MFAIIRCRILRLPLFLSKNIKTTTKSTTILPAVLYGSESRSLAFTEEQRLRVFQNVFHNRVLRRIFG